MRFSGRGKVIFTKWFTLALCLALMTIFTAGAFASEESVGGIKKKAAKETGKKVIVFFLDAVSWDDINSADMPFLKKMAGSNGHVGLMNTKTNGMNRVNRESGYFTIGAGVRANAPDQSGTTVEAIEDGQIRVEGIETLKEIMREELPNYRAGQLGQTAKEKGLKVGLVGNADTEIPHREAALAAMDEEGIIPYGSIGKELLVEDRGFPGKFRTNEKVLFSKVSEFLSKTDILFIDFGDTARINEYHQSIANVFAERQKALERADRFIGKLDKIIDWQNTMLLVVVPNASETSIDNGNTSLTPVIAVSGNQGPGLLISNTTRREALVANIDLAPTIINYLTGEKGDFIGEAFTYRINETVSGLDNLNYVEKREQKFYNLRWGRFISHGFYVTLIVLTLAFSFVPSLARYFRVSEDLRYRLSVLTLTFPLTVFVIGPLLPYRHFIFETVMILLIAIVLSQLLINLLEKREYIITALTLTTFFVLLSYLFFAPSFLLNSPIGFAEVFLGGRYYGANNDSMGIMLGAGLMGFFSLAQWTGFPHWVKKIMIIVPLLLAILSLTPLYGANVGGTITAMSVTILAGLRLFTKGPLTWRKVLIVIGLVFFTEVMIAYAEYLFDLPRTHAGKAINALLTQGIVSKFSELLYSKLRLFGMMAVIPPYNLIMLGEIIIFSGLFKGKDSFIDSFSNRFSEIFSSMRVFFYGGLIAFFFNDTGVIATAMMYTYFLIPYAILNKN